MQGEHECGRVGPVDSDCVAKLTKRVYLNCVDQNHLTTTQITKQKICSPWRRGRSLHGEHECGRVRPVDSDCIAKLTKRVYLNCVDLNYLTTTMLNGVT